MRVISIIGLLACILTPAHGQYLPPQPNTPNQPVPGQQQGMTLAQKCALASAYIKAGNCGPQGCDIGLCVALQNGCRINHWGHSCPWTRQQ